MRRLGVLVVGQSPRPEIEDEFARLLGDVQVELVGCLDGMDRHELTVADTSGDLLFTRLPDGSDVTLAKSVVVEGGESQISALEKAGVDTFAFEYVKVKGGSLYTRPTSSDHYIVNLASDGLEVVYAQPNLQSRMIELHKGHGPTAFKTFQKAFAVGLVFIILSGLWLGLSATKLRRATTLTVAAGALTFLLLLF